VNLLPKLLVSKVIRTKTTVNRINTFTIPGSSSRDLGNAHIIDLFGAENVINSFNTMQTLEREQQRLGLKD